VESDTIREILAKALKRQEELREEFEALQSVIAHYRRQMARPLGEGADEQASLDLRMEANSLKARSAYISRLMDEARRLIVRDGRPLKRGELVHQLEREGFPVEGRDKAKVLGTNLWRSGKFEHIEGAGYWPRDLPLPKRREDRENR
jgi:hypothetical protein